MNEAVVAILLVVLFVMVVIGAPICIGVYKTKKHRNPFYYPYMNIGFDVSRKKNPKIEDYIDEYLKENGIEELEKHCQYVGQWKVRSLDIANASHFKKERLKQLTFIIDDEHMFNFCMYRKQTRYKQKNYVKYPYVVNMPCGNFSTNIDWIRERYAYLNS